MNSFGFLIIIVAFVFLWFVVMRPQKRRQAEQQRMLGDLRVGDEVLTAGGVYGSITRIADDVVTVEVAAGLELRVARRAIAGVTRDEPEAEPAAAAEPEQAGEEPDGPGSPVDENPG
ncbi:MAG: preprotein translocase subunit YajC [Gaiellaceae bacterium]